MKTRKKIMIGGLGALTPVIMNLLIVDFDVLFIKLTFLAFLGYIIRVIILFYIGGITAFLHKNENSPVKIFELGIVAPALITALINAGNIEVPKNNFSMAGTSHSSIIFVSPAYAQPTPPKEEIKTFSLPEGTRMQQIWRGLIGATPKNVWFVIVGLHPTLEDAKRQVQQINQEGKKITAEVYAPYKGNPYYAVVIGANLIYKEAQYLRQQAIAAGFFKNTYLWTFPKR